MKTAASLLTLAIMAAGSVSAATSVANYPSLDRKQMGAMRHIVELANLPPGSWKYMEPESRFSNDSVQFQIAYMSYLLAVVQSQVTPAYRELYHQALRKLIGKILQRDVWDLWLAVIEVPDFKKYLDPSKDWRDPVREKNIMYSGHLLQMIGLYEALYDDREFDQPGSIVFELPGKAGFTHSYDHASLAKLIADQFARSDHKGIECEPNRIFMECNEHAVLGLMQFDQIHGTNLSDARHRFWQKAEDMGYIDPETHRTMWFYKVKEKEQVKDTYAWSDGWNGMMLNGWNREFVAKAYPAQRDAELPALIDPDPEHWRVRWGRSQVSQDFGFLAAYSAEVGDRATTGRLLDYADGHFSPQWVNGAYFYPRHDVVGEEYAGPSKPVPANLMGQHQVGPLAGNALLNFARLNPGQGIWNLYNKFSVASFAHSGDPEVVEIRYPEVQITQAYYDKSQRRLTVAMIPGTAHQGRISFGIRNLSGQARYLVTFDGTEKAAVERGHVHSTARHSWNAAWEQASQLLRLDCILANGHTVLIEER